MNDYTYPYIPASIRNNNPGAQWYGPIAKKWGATGGQSVSGGNNVATFPDAVSGAAAHLDLLQHNYSGMTLNDAIGKWSGNTGGSDTVNAYTNSVAKAAGIKPDTVLTPELLSGPTGVAIAKAQANWEAGTPSPITDDQWTQAQKLVNGNAPPAAAPVTPDTAAQGTGGLLGNGAATPAPDASASANPLSGLLGLLGNKGGGAGTNGIMGVAQSLLGAGQPNNNASQQAAAQSQQAAAQALQQANQTHPLSLMPNLLNGPTI